MKHPLTAAVERSMPSVRENMFQNVINALKHEGWRIVKLEIADFDPSGPEWTTYTIEDEL